ncbi:unnamed protein product [Durusdinium trenchii]|uniref:Uncharacterized protein n=1 Tax=Durusdinium trenchii TaxID=1381693 RepID=A0ABP0T0R5_9DINO
MDDSDSSSDSAEVSQVPVAPEEVEAEDEELGGLARRSPEEGDASPEEGCTWSVARGWYLRKDQRFWDFLGRA